MGKEDAWMWTHTLKILPLEEKLFGDWGCRKCQPVTIGLDQVHSYLSKAQGSRDGGTSPHFSPQEMTPLGFLVGFAMFLSSVISE